MKLFKLFSVMFLAVLLSVIGVGVTNAAVSVQGPYPDTTTQGDWRQTFATGGSCFYLLPMPASTPKYTEFLVDTTADPVPYTCSGGSFITNGQLSWNMFSGPLDDKPIYAWYFDPTDPITETRPSGGGHPADQWNPCMNNNQGGFYGATFDNGDLDPARPIFNPLTSEVTLDFTGSLRIAYYFLEEYRNRCSEFAYEFIVNDVKQKEGMVSDVDTGKYAYFDVSGLEGTSKIRLEVKNTLNTPCAPEPTYPNAHISGIFIDKCYYCGDGIVQAGEQCDDGNQIDDDACSNNCTYNPMGCTGTPGYWINHPEAWPVDSISIGGTTYTKSQAIELMKMPVKGDKTLTLFPALVSAKLNFLNGANDSCISATITAADAWMAAYSVTSKVLASSDAWKAGEPLYLRLDSYNNGRLCAPHCD